jgi:hypothetical protein
VALEERVERILGGDGVQQLVRQLGDGGHGAPPSSGRVPGASMMRPYAAGALATWG